MNKFEASERTMRLWIGGDCLAVQKNKLHYVLMGLSVSGDALVTSKIY